MNKDALETKLIRLFLVLSIGMYFVITSFSFVISWINTELHEEHLSWERDSIIGNILALALAFAIAFFLEKKSKVLDKVNMDVVALIVSIIMSAVAIWWIFNVNTSPVDDQRKICYSASQINAGDYHLFEKGMYLAECPHQLGLVTLMRVLYLIFGDENYLPFRILTALSISLIVFSGYKITAKLTGKKSMELIYLLFALTCLPIYFYAPYVYGELLSIAGLLCSFWMLLELIDNFKWPYLIVFGVMVFFSIMVRKNSLIPIIAMIIVVILRMLFDKKLKYLLLLAIILVAVMAQSMMVKVLYKDCFKEDGKAVPSILWVSMGTMDEARHAGWYDGSNFRIFEDNDCDPEVASAVAVDVLKDFFQFCKENPKDGANFYMRKITAQWDAPMYQAIVMNHNVEGEQGKLAEWAYSPEKSWKYLDAWMNVHQLIVYVSVLLWLILRWKNPGKIQEYVIPIAIYGGFIFSIIWEAKSRYILPYYVIMLPVAAFAISGILDRVNDRGRNK